MRSLLLLVASIIGVKAEAISPGLTTTAGTLLHKEAIGPIEENGSEASRKRVAEFADKYGVALTVNEELVTNEANFIRPCADYRKKCIRKFLAKNSYCKPMKDKVDPLYLAQNTAYLPYTNMTVTYANYTVTGFDDAKITEFYYNKETCNVVLAIKVPRLKESAPPDSAFFTYQRTARESITLADFDTMINRDVIYTVIIPRIPNLRLDFAEIHAFLTEANAEITTGPKAYTSNDPDVNDAWTQVLQSDSILGREDMLFKSQLYMANYIQKHLCDFGVDLYSV